MNELRINQAIDNKMYKQSAIGSRESKSCRLKEDIEAFGLHLNSH